MPAEVHSPPEQSFTALVRGIVNDVGDLIKQQFRFAQAELRSDMHKTREATLALAAGASVALLGVLVLTLMLVFLLHWLTIPADTVNPDPARLPLWACFGIVGAVLTGLGAVLVVAGKKKFDSFNPLPDQTIQTARENLNLEAAQPWTANSK
jgi:hypothetical protein